MLFFDWFKSLLGYFGLWRKPCKLLIIGLDNAGKTTLLHRLKNDHFAQHSPTIHPTCESFTMEGLTMAAYDLGGHQIARRIWTEYVPAVDCILFMMDAAGKNRFDEAKDELERLLSDDQVSDVPILVMGNKIDLQDAVSEDELTYRMGLVGSTTGKKTLTAEERQLRRPMEVFMCSLLRKQGYGEGLRWLASQLE